MTYQTNHLKLPILSVFVFFVYWVVKKPKRTQNIISEASEPYVARKTKQSQIPILVFPGPSVLGTLGSWILVFLAF